MLESTDVDERTLAGGGADIAGPAGDVVRPESVHDRDDPDGTEFTLWLFSSQGAREVKASEVADLITHDENLLWVDLSGYTSDSLANLGKTLGLERDEIQAAATSWQRPRIQMYTGRFFVSVTIAVPDAATYSVTAGELDLFVGNNYLVTAHRLALPFAQRILTRAKMSPELVRLDSAYMLYIVLDEVLAYYEDIFEDIQTDIDRLEERALIDTSDSFLEDLVRFKRYVTALNRLAEQHRQVYSAFLRPDFQFVSAGDVDTYYRDLETRLARLLETLGSARDAATGAFEVYVSQMAHRTNKIIKVLTIVSATLLPVSVVITFFGTSFKSLPIYSARGFTIMLFIIAVILSGAGMFFRSSGWL